MATLGISNRVAHQDRIEQSGRWRGFLGRAREEGAEGDIIGTRLARLHGEMAAVMGGDADLRRGAEQGAGLARVAVVLAEMDSVGADPLRQRRRIVDDEGDLARGAKPLQRPGEARRLVLVDSLHPKLEGGHGTGVERGGEPVRKVAADLERRDQIELAGGTARVAHELRREIRIERVHRHAARARCRSRSARNKGKAQHSPMP